MAPSKTIPWRKDSFTPAFTGLLDQSFASGATAAYSLRLLRADHSGGLVRVRADDQGTSKGEADALPILQPDGSKIITLDSPIENFQGTPFSGDGYVLADLVDAGNGNYDGLISKWYGQTANKNDASNSTANEQPQIVNSGTVITESKNGKPALQFNNAQYLFKNNMNGDLVEYYEVIEQNEGGTFIQRQILFTDKYTNSRTYFVGAAQKGGSGNLSSGVGTPTHTFLKSPNPSTRDDFYNALEGVLELVNIYNISNLSTGFDFGLSGYNSGEWYLNGKVQEVIGYPSNKSSSDRSDIKTEIDNYYTIQ